MKGKKVEWEKIPTPIPLQLMLSKGTQVWVKGELKVLFSPNEAHPDGMWKHLSISHPKRYPIWDEILAARYEFFFETDDVAQVLPPKSEYVNVSKNCFHLWSPIGRRLTPLT